MNKEFVSYEMALALKELGFDEPCFAWYKNGKLRIELYWNLSELRYEDCIAPTFSQAFRWFREKYNLFSCIMTEYSYGGHISAYHINGVRQSNISVGDFTTYEEAELACLLKLIEVVKKK